MKQSVYRVMAAITVLCSALLVACGSASVPTPTQAPPTPTPEPTAPPETIAKGKNVFLTTGCGACHAVKGMSEALAAPPHDDLYDLSVQVMASPDYKKAGGIAKNVRDYILESILNPNIYIYPKCPQGPCLKGTMPTNYKDIIRPEDFDALMAFMVTLGRK